MLEILFAFIVGVVLPMRAWRRYRRQAPRTPPGHYILETLLSILALAGLLWRHDVTLAAIGVQPVLTAGFFIDLAICLAVVIGLDILSLQLTARQMRSVTAVVRLEAGGLPANAVTDRRALAWCVPVSIIGAIWEELCFRAAVFQLVPQTLWGLAFGVAAGALAFGAQHLRNGVPGFAYACFYGVLFAYLYLATGNLIAVIVAHAAGNIFAATYGARQVARARTSSAFLG